MDKVIQQAVREAGLIVVVVVVVLVWCWVGANVLAFGYLNPPSMV